MVFLTSQYVFLMLVSVSLQMRVCENISVSLWVEDLEFLNKHIHALFRVLILIEKHIEIPADNVNVFLEMFTNVRFPSN